MAKAPSPLLGYNNNVRHKNRVFHIQTEDSGIKHPHVITHLFMDGGRILKSVKKSYADIVGSEGMSELVRQMMKEQHKAMFIALRDGQFDHLVDNSVNKPPGAHPSAAAPARSPSMTDAYEARPADSAGLRAAQAEAQAPVFADGTIPAPPPSDPAAASLASLASISIESPPTTREPLPMASEDATAPGTADALTLDIDALERAQTEVADADARSAFRANHDLPPPPANLFKRPDAGRYRNYTAGAEETDDATPTRSAAPPSRGAAPPASARSGTGAGASSRLAELAAAHAPASASPATPPAATGPKAVPAPPPSAPGPGEGRYAPARPAAIFGQARPQQGSSIFGEDLISDKSLDEVILSYLAEDLEVEKK